MYDDSKMLLEQLPNMQLRKRLVVSYTVSSAAVSFCEVAPFPVVPCGRDSAPEEAGSHPRRLLSFSATRKGRGGPRLWRHGA